jgi:hypothetical protein
MMSNPHEIRTVRCAHCGRLRQETNHWFVTSASDGTFRCVPLTDGTGKTPAVRISPAFRKKKLRKNQEPVCGQHCAQRLFERYLAQEAMREHLPLGSGQTASLPTANPRN